MGRTSVADEKLKTRRRVGFVVMLGAIVALAGAPSIALAQSDAEAGRAPEGSGDESGATPAPDASAPETSSEATPDAEAAAEPESTDEQPESTDEQAESTGDTADALSSGEQAAAATSEEEATDEAAGSEEAAEEAQAEREPLPWRNSFFSYYLGVTPNTFFRDAQLSYDPLVYNYLSLTPRWYLDPQLFFALSQSVSYEMTNDGESSSYNHDVQLSDTVVELRRTTPWEGFIFIPAVRVTLPASKASQAAQRYFGLGAAVTAVRVIPEAWSMTIAAQVGYRYWFAGSNVPLTSADTMQQAYPPGGVTRDPDVGGFAPSPTLGQASGTTTARHIAFGGLTINVTPFEGFNVTLQGYYFTQEGHGLADACTSGVLTSPDGAYCDNGDGPTHWRHGTSLGLYLAYDIQPWFNLSVGWSNSFNLAPLFGPDGSVYSPFNPQNQFSLSATFQIDGIYETLTAGGEDDGLTPEQRQRRRQGLAQRQSTTGGSL